MKASALTLFLATAGLAAAHPIVGSNTDLRVRADQEASTESVTSADQLESTRRIHFPGTGRSADNSANVYVNGHWGGRRLFPGAASSSAQQKRADDDNSEEVSVADLTSDGTSADQIGASGMRRINGIGRREDATEEKKEAAASEQPAAADQKEEKTDAAPASTEQPATSTNGDQDEEDDDDDPDSHGRMRRIGGPGKRDDEGTQTVDTSAFAGDGASADEIEASQTRRVKGFPPRPPRRERKRQDSQTVNVGDLDTDGDADDVDDSKRRRIKGFPPRRREQQAKRADTETVSVSDLTGDGTSADELEASQTRRIKGIGKRQDTETVSVSDLTSDGTDADDLEANQTRRIKGIGGGKLARGFEA